MEKNGTGIFFKGIFGCALFLGVLYYFPWKNITWGRVLLGNEGVITVSGYAESEEKNQIANFSAGVNAINDNKDAAVNEVNQKMTVLIKAVKAMGVEDADIKTQQVSVYQMQENVPIQPDGPVMMGGNRVRLGQWNASNTISITLRNVEKAGELTDILNNSGANNVYGPSFQLDTSKKAEDKLTEAAVADARLKAVLMARASGSQLGRVVSIVEGGQSPNIYPLMMRAESAKIMDIGTPAPVQVGTTKISKTVTVVWSLR